MIDGLRAGALAVAADGHICDANPGAAQILRIPLGELRGARLEEVLAPIDKLGAPAPADGPSPVDGRDRVELSLRLRDGQQAVLGCSASEVTSDLGRGWVVLFQEISGLVELKRQHERLLQLAAVGESLPSVLHEIRNPLASVTSMLEILVEEADGSHQADLHALLGEIRRIVLTLQGIGGLHADLASNGHEAIDTAVREACRIMKPMAEQRGVRVRCEVPDLPLLPLRAPVVRGIVFNLVRNAIDACGSDGDMVLSAALAPDGASLAITVQDTGRGMSEEELARCCDIFFTTKEHGSGIGLPICRRVVERAGGTLGIRSQRGVGTVVVVTVPIAVKKPQER